MEFLSQKYEIPRKNIRAQSNASQDISFALELLTSRYIQQHIPSRARYICHVRVISQGLDDRFARLDLPQRHKRFTRLVQRLRDHRGGLCLTLGTDDSGLPLLLSLCNQISDFIHRRPRKARTFSTMNFARSASVHALSTPVSREK